MNQPSQPKKISEVILAKLIFDRLDKLEIGTRYRGAELSRCRMSKDIQKYFIDLEPNVLEGKGLLFCGPVGVGKTCSLVVMIKMLMSRLIEKEFMNGLDGVLFETGHYKYPSCKFITANQISDSIFQKDFKRMQSLKDTIFLFIDDFGREYFHDWPFSAFEELIDYRYASKLPVFITTNFTPAALAANDKYQRIVDRWRECCTTIQISGSSLRRE